MAKKFDFKRIGMRVAGVSVGAAAGTFANKPLVNMNPKLRGALKIGIGAILPELAPKGDFLKDVGAGIMATGVADLMVSFIPSMAGIEGIGESESDFVNGIGADDLAIGAEDYVITDQVNGMGETDDMSGLGAEDNAIQGIDGEITNEAY